MKFLTNASAMYVRSFFEACARSDRLKADERPVFDAFAIHSGIDENFLSRVFFIYDWNFDDSVMVV